MKKIYVLLVVCFSVVVSVNAQTYYWIGPANGSWNSGTNWSLSSGGPSAGSFPQDNADNVIINTNASIWLNTSVTLNSLSVNGTSTEAIITGADADQTITVTSTNLLTPALSIAAGCKLEHGSETNTWFRFIFDDNTVATINGEWYFGGDYDDGAFATFFFANEGNNTNVQINTGGSITIGPKAITEPNENTGNTYLVFNAGSTLKLLGDNPIVPAANYNASSIIQITGVTMSSSNFEEMESVGNVDYNCPAQSSQVYLSLLNITVKGNLNIYNTNNNDLSIISYNAITGLPSHDATIKGNLNIQGNSKVTVAHNNEAGPEVINNLYVEGNVIMNGTSFSLHSNNNIHNKATTLFVKGNIQHTAGTFDALATSVNQTTNLFVVEMNGNTPQTISSHSGTFDNANNQVTLRINNSAGVTLLNSLQVGRISFNSANKGILHTGANTLTINNTTPGSASSLVVESPSATGFVDGTVRRRTASTEPLVLPAGTAAYRPVTLVPSSAIATTYEAKFIDNNHDGSLTAPVRVIAPYYWEVARVGAGADAAVQLNIFSQLPGALTGYDLAVTRFDGASWISTKGTTGLIVQPGTAASGTVRSEAQSAFGLFTISLESESALPTYLLAFDAKKTTKESAAISWKITHNSTPEKFEVLRSGDGLNFVAIGTVPGAEAKRDYQFTDQAMLQGNNFYRLRMSDRDGSVTYSAIILLTRNVMGVEMQSMMPTLVRDMAKLKINSSLKTTVQLVVTDAQGRLLMNQHAKVSEGSQDIWLNLSKLNAGTFQVTAYVSGQKTATIRFIKQ